MSDLIRRLGYEPRDLTLPDKLAEHVIRLRRWVLIVAVSGVVGMALTTWLVWQPARYTLQVSGAMGYRLDTHTGKIEGFHWTSGTINP
jgi:hypothetical protein